MWKSSLVKNVEFGRIEDNAIMVGQLREKLLG